MRLHSRCVIIDNNKIQSLYKILCSRTSLFFNVFFFFFLLLILKHVPASFCINDQEFNSDTKRNCYITKNCSWTIRISLIFSTIRVNNGNDDVKIIADHTRFEDLSKDLPIKFVTMANVVNILNITSFQ